MSFYREWWVVSSGCTARLLRLELGERTETDMTRETDLTGGVGKKGLGSGAVGDL